MKDSREKRVKIGQLKARLSEYLRAVRRGHSVMVTDRDTPIARLVPVDAEHESRLPSTLPVRALRDVLFPPPLERPVDSLAALLEERQSQR